MWSAAAAAHSSSLNVGPICNDSAAEGKCATAALQPNLLYLCLYPFDYLKIAIIISSFEELLDNRILLVTGKLPKGVDCRSLLYSATKLYSASQKY